MSADATMNGGDRTSEELPRPHCTTTPADVATEDVKVPAARRTTLRSKPHTGPGQACRKGLGCDIRAAQEERQTDERPGHTTRQSGHTHPHSDTTSTAQQAESWPQPASRLGNAVVHECLGCVRAEGGTHRSMGASRGASGTCTGAPTCSMRECSTWPWALQPQAHTSPALSSASACECPHCTATTRGACLARRATRSRRAALPAVVTSPGPGAGAGEGVAPPWSLLGKFTSVGTRTSARGCTAADRAPGRDQGETTSKTRRLTHTTGHRGGYPKRGGRKRTPDERASSMHQKPPKEQSPPHPPTW
jgi:hypothetical protein